MTRTGTQIEKIDNTNYELRLGRDAATNSASPPDANPHVDGHAVFELDASAVIDWTPPVMQ